MTESELTNAQYDLLSLLAAEISQPSCFEMYGYIFLGNKIAMLKKYVKANPSDKLFVWLQKNYEVLKTDYK